jgi:hypothetical protein
MIIDLNEFEQVLRAEKPRTTLPQFTGFPNIAGITNTPQASLFTNDQAALLADDTTDDAGIEEEYYEQFPETGTLRSGIESLFNKVKGSRLAQAFLGTINPIFGGIAGLIGNRPGIRGGIGLRGDSIFDTFGRSTSLVDFAQRMRDKRAREEAARIGAAKQKAIIAGQQVDTGDITVSSGDRPGGFGQGAGGFRESEPTATEGSF